MQHQDEDNRSKKSGPDTLPENTLYLGKGSYLVNGEFLTSDNSLHKNDKSDPPKSGGPS